MTEKYMKPTLEQASKLMEKEVIEEIKNLEEKLIKYRILLQKLWCRKAKIEITDYKKRQWYIRTEEDYENVYTFIDKTKTVTIKKSRF